MEWLQKRFLAHPCQRIPACFWYGLASTHASLEVTYAPFPWGTQVLAVGEILVIIHMRLSQVEAPVAFSSSYIVHISRAAMALEGAVTRCRFLHSSDGLLINCRFCDVLMWGEDDNAPMDCRKCSSFLACRKCYNRMESERTRCACGLQINSQSYGLARSLIEQQKSLHIYCQHKQLGCNWTGCAEQQQDLRGHQVCAVCI